MPREFSRKQRVAAEIQRLLSELLRVEVKDPRLDGVTINDVEVSGDLGVAKIYFGTLDPEQDTDEARKAFGSAAGFLRSRVGQALRIRRVPELHFVHDTSAQRGIEMSRLLDELSAGSGGAAGDDGEEEGSNTRDAGIAKDEPRGEPED
jgi:ribosome-binding factor A